MRKAIIPMLVGLLVFGGTSMTYAGSHRQDRNIREIRDMRLMREARELREIREGRTSGDIKALFCNRFADRWFMSSLCDDVPQPVNIVINEVYYDISGNSEDGEWVELYNAGSGPVSLNGWSIRDSVSDPDFFNTDIVLLPGEFALVGASQEIFDIAWAGEIPDGAHVIIAKIGNALNNPGDSVHLIDADGQEVDAMSYGNNDSVLNPSVPVGEKGHSLSRSPNGADTDTAMDWVELELPTPGT